MSATREGAIEQAAWHIDKCCTGGDDNDWIAAERIVEDLVDPLAAEVERLRTALAKTAGIATAALTGNEAS